MYTIYTDSVLHKRTPQPSVPSESTKANENELLRDPAATLGT